MALVGAVPALAAPASTAENVVAYRALVALDARLNAVGERLALANAGWCTPTVARTGAMLHDIAQYPDRNAAYEAFRFVESVTVAAVAPGSPAAEAGLLPGDALVMVGVGQDALMRFALATPERASASRITALRKVLDTFAQHALARGEPLTLAVLRPGEGGDELPAFKLTPRPGCASRFQIVTDTPKSAGADGTRVSIGKALAESAPDDTALAAIVAHELAHNILQHRARIDAARNRIGTIRRTEEEADRLSIWLLWRAGYDIDSAISFWQNRKSAAGFDLYHAKWSTRIGWMREEQQRIAAAGADGRPSLLTAE